jgi:hypothetical protein
LSKVKNTEAIITAAVSAAFSKPQSAGTLSLLQVKALLSKVEDVDAIIDAAPYLVQCPDYCILLLHLWLQVKALLSKVEDDDAIIDAVPYLMPRLHPMRTQVHDIRQHQLPHSSVPAATLRNVALDVSAPFNCR